MAPADHLIERAAALLQSGAKPADVPTARSGLLLPGTAAPAEPAAFDTPATLPAFVPAPPDRPVLIQPEPPRAAAADTRATTLAPAPGTPSDLPSRDARQSPAAPGNAPGNALGNAPGDTPADVLADGAQPAGNLIGYDVMQAAGMIVARGSRSRISEEYRIVLGRVLRAQREDQQGAAIPNLLLVTSAKPGEGKSFTSLNLAGSIAQHTTEKVLLVDLDAKVRPMTALLQAGDGPGFYDLVADPSLPLQSVIRPTAIAGLSFLPVGHRAPDAGTGSGNPITNTIIRLARAFPQHIVILDAAPCLSTSDPSTVAPIVGQIVMVIEAERTQRSEVEAALELVRVCPTITMLLNKVRMTTSHTFGAYDYYGNYS